MQALINEAAAMMKNAVVMKFVRGEALQKVAEEMQKEGYTCTAKGVEILAIRHKNIETRVNEYVVAGIMGCLKAKYEVKHAAAC